MANRVRRKEGKEEGERRKKSGKDCGREDGGGSAQRAEEEGRRGEGGKAQRVAVEEGYKGKRK